jgi:hypothetical protein
MVTTPFDKLRDRRAVATPFDELRDRGGRVQHEAPPSTGVEDGASQEVAQR